MPDTPKIDPAVARLDAEMMALQQATGWEPYATDVARRQADAMRQLLSAPQKRLTLEQVYGLIGEINALAAVLGIPETLSKRAVAERQKVVDAEAELDTPTYDDPRTIAMTRSATARAARRARHE